MCIDTVIYLRIYLVWCNDTKLLFAATDNSYCYDFILLHNLYRIRSLFRSEFAFPIIIIIIIIPFLIFNPV